MILQTKELKQAVKLLKGATNPYVPHLAGVRILGSVEGLSLTAIDLDRRVEAVFPEDSEMGDWEVLVDFNTFAKTVKNIRTKQVRVEPEGERLRVGDSLLQSDDAGEFPASLVRPDRPKSKILIAPGQEVHEAVSLAVAMLPRKRPKYPRPCDEGVLLDTVEGRAVVVGTDSAQLSAYRLQGECYLEGKYVIPHKTARLIADMAKGTPSVTILYTPNDEKDCPGFVTVEAGRVILQSRLLETVYPDWRAVIPPDGGPIWTIRRTDLINALKSTEAIVMACGKDKIPIVDLTANGRVLYVSAKHDNMGDACKEVSVEGAGFASALFDWRKIYRFLKALPKRVRTVKFVPPPDEYNPSVWGSEEAEEITYLLMPCTR